MWVFDFPYKDQIYLDFGIDGELAETISEKAVEEKEEMLKNVEELGSTFKKVLFPADTTSNNQYSHL